MKRNSRNAKPLSKESGTKTSLLMSILLILLASARILVLACYRVHIRKALTFDLFFLKLRLLSMYGT